jgi:hypothetical protein
VLGGFLNRRFLSFGMRLRILALPNTAATAATWALSAHASYCISGGDTLNALSRQTGMPR